MTLRRRHCRLYVCVFDEIMSADGVIEAFSTFDTIKKWKIIGKRIIYANN